MTIQRRRKALSAVVWKSKVEKDRRGNRQLRANQLDKVPLKVWVMPQRSSRAEVPGQQQINVTRIGFNLPAAEVEDVTLWSRLEMGGKEWDFATPPIYHHGIARHTRHWSADIRERP